MAIRDMAGLLSDLLRRVGLLERRQARLGVAKDTTPAGVVVPFAGSTAPLGYLLANGATVLIADQPDLFAVIGNLYGGNGTTNFILPDMRGRTAVGLSAGDSDFGTLGAAPGAKTHTLTQAQMPSHTHTQNAHSHGGQFGGQFVQTGSGGAAANVTTGGNGYVTGSTATATATNQSAGSGGAHNNIQPSRTLNYIIKT